jgi:hypothetical protein
VATKKITITLPEETLDTLRASAAAAGLPLSTYLADVTAHHARIQDGLAAMSEWDEVTEPVDDETRAKVDRELDRLDELARGGIPDTEPTRRAS